jgi:HSP20 family protein
MRNEPVGKGVSASAEPTDRSTPAASGPGACYDPAVAFARWDPIRDLLAIQQHLDRFAPGQAGWTPPVDLHETADAYVLTAELPGLSQDNLHIHAHDGRLTISGMRRERPAACEQHHRVERGHGSFSRTFVLPVPIEADRITAELRDGVLTVICPKAAEVTGRRIDVS